MRDALRQYVAALIDRIDELYLENHVLKEMLRKHRTVPVGDHWEDTLRLTLESPEAAEKRREFDLRRDSILQILDRDDVIEAMLKLPTKGLPN